MDCLPLCLDCFVRIYMLFDFVLILHTRIVCHFVFTVFVRTYMLFDFVIILHTHGLCATLYYMTVFVRTCLLFDFVLFCTRMSCVPFSLPFCLSDYEFLFELLVCFIVLSLFEHPLVVCHCHMTVFVLTSCG